MIKTLIFCLGVSLGAARYDSNNSREGLPTPPDPSPRNEEFYDTKPLAVIRDDEIMDSLRYHARARLRQNNKF